MIYFIVRVGFNDCFVRKVYSLKYEYLLAHVDVVLSIVNALPNLFLY